MGDGFYELGRAFMQQGRRAEAEAAFRKAFGIDPSNDAALFDLAQCLEHNLFRCLSHGNFEMHLEPI